MKRLLIYYTTAIIYFELIYRLWVLRNLSPDFIFPVLFALPAGALLYLATGLFNARVNRVAAIVLMSVLSLVYEIQLIYFCIFRTPLALYSLVGAEDTLQFGNIVLLAILKNSPAVVLLFVPLAVLVVPGRIWRKAASFLTAGKAAGIIRTALTRLEKLGTMAVSLIPSLCFRRLIPKSLLLGLALFAASFALSVICVNLTRDGDLTQYDMYYKMASPQLSIDKLGLMTTVRLDFQRLVFGFDGDDGAYTAAFGANTQDAGTKDKDAGSDKVETGTAADNTGNSTIPESSDVTAKTQGASGQVSEASASESGPMETNPASVKEYNTLNIDFNSLIANEKDPELLDMHKYFSAAEPTKTNKYTGMFKGCNLILITAEGFSPYFIKPELTPTLYRMATQGFVFNNFYNPIWGVSTSDGEYVGCTGLIPKSGVWSMARSGQNLLPFVMGNQFKKLGYTTTAYHDHTYTYYKRNISHPNLGYVYKGVGNGLVVKKTWPESDLEMIDATAGDFTADKPFHVYYMTVSGHMNYSFSGNAMAAKNKSLVENLPYSEPSKAYIACNLELEAAMQELVAKLEAAGVADKTVIALSGDHYPYGLPKENIDELAGHKVEDNFELYKSMFILWKEGMQPVQVDKPCCSLDRIPTLSNLFGLEYDSRLLMGYDILSDSPPLVIFSNYSWITDRAMYDSSKRTAKFTDGTEEDKSYVRAINKKVNDKFTYSAKILDTDYYRKIEQYLD